MFKSSNVGTLDRLFRLIVGVALIAAPYFYVSEIWADDLYRYGLPAVGGILILTALVRFCPLYRIFGLRTCR